MTLLTILTAIANSLWQAAALAGLVWLALKWVRVNAATRFVIWWAVLGLLFVLPVVPRDAANWYRPAGRKAALHRGEALPTPNLSVLRVDDAEPYAIVTLPQEPGPEWPLAVVALWISMLIYRLARVAQSYLYLRGVKRNAVVSHLPLPEVGRQLRLLVSDDIASPMAVGFLRPSIILPAGLEQQITRGELDQILLHEAAHLARRDDWSNFAGRVAASFLAFHPVAWWILRQIEYEREAACDDWVVARTGAARLYAASLARMVELRWEHARTRSFEEALASGVFGRGSRIGDRIEMLLRAGREFSPRVSLRRVALSAGVLTGLAVAGSFAPRWIAFAKTSPVPRPEPRSAEPHPRLITQTPAVGAIPARVPEKAASSSSKPVSGQAEPPAPRRLIFEVAAIRAHAEDEPLHVMRGFSSSGPRLTLEGYTLRYFILEAYNLKNYQFSLDPSIAKDQTYYDVHAKAEGEENPTKNEFRQMLQVMLAERFHLKFHREMREIPVYALVVGRNGPKFKESAPEVPGGSPIHLAGVNGRNQNLTLTQGSMDAVADFIPSSLFVDRPVLDQTGLKGRYDIKLEATPEFRINNNPQPEDVSVFDAVQNQLGLKLEPQKANIEVLVVDHIEKPSEN